MIQAFAPGAIKQITHRVSESDTACFAGEEVHPVYATFAVAREAEWACRQFVLAMKEPQEEGIGTFVTVEHHSPALVGSEVCFTARLDKVDGHAVICSWEAHSGPRLVASGRTGQKILPRDRIAQLFDSLR
ncbi:MAG: thioesterase family protein [Bacteroidia bacterium]